MSSCLDLCSIFLHHNLKSCLQQYSGLTAQGGEQKLTALHYAIGLQHDPEIIRLLIDRLEPSDLDPQDSKGNTPLHHAIKNNLLEIVKLLIAKGADINPDFITWTP